MLPPEPLSSSPVRGAVRFAAWLHARAPDAFRLTGMHVCDDSETTDALTSSEAWIDVEQARSAFDTVELVAGDSVEASLCAEAAKRGVDGLIVGRPGTIEGWSPISLGRTIRRLLRSTPVPTLVVPPDVDVRNAGRTIVVAVNPRDESLSAVRFASRLATQFDLEPILFQVSHASTYRMTGVTEAALTHSVPLADAERREKSASDAMAEWTERHGFGALRRVTTPGRSVVATVSQGARELGAALIVTGSRQLSLSERILQSSVGSGLAAYAGRPVLIVPPED